jgi:hypothetical protein
VSRRARVILILAFGIVLVLSVRTVVAFARFSRVKREFVSVQNGESRASVITKLGKPNYYAGAGGVIHIPDKNCAAEYVYSNPFAPLVPDYYIVSFSSDDRVIEAGWWNLP